MLVALLLVLVSFSNRKIILHCICATEINGGVTERNWPPIKVAFCVSLAHEQFLF